MKKLRKVEKITKKDAERAAKVLDRVTNRGIKTRKDLLKIIKPENIGSVMGGTKGESVENNDDTKLYKTRVEKVPTLIKKTVEKAEEKAGEREKKRQNEYKLFSVWLSLPRQILGKTIEEYTDKMGLDDPLYLELLQIKTQKEFAQKFDLNEMTLVAWRKELGGMNNDKEMHNFFDRFTKSLLLSFYREQLRRPTPQGVETWYEIIKDRKKNLNINLEGEVKTSLSEEAKNELKGIINGVRRK